jgi:hypothetical protein
MGLLLMQAEGDEIDSFELLVKFDRVEKGGVGIEACAAVGGGNGSSLEYDLRVVVLDWKWRHVEQRNCFWED